MTLVLLVATGLACAVATRLWLPAREKISTAATTIGSVTAALVVGLLVNAAVGGVLGEILAVVLGAGAALGATQVGADALAAQRERRRRRGPKDKPPVLQRVEDFTEAHPLSVGQINVPLLVVRCARRISHVRVTGLAAEMTYYALISILPLVTAFAAALGSLERFVGAERVQQIQTTVVDQVVALFDNQIGADVLAPLVEGLLGEERTGVAIGGTLVALWLASRMFRAAIRALDDAYTVEERRSFFQQVMLGLALALGAVLTLVVLLSMLVIGPLLGGGEEIADLLGLGSVFTSAWELLRWPAVVLLAVGFLVLLYRYGPNVSTTWQRCLPGAVGGTVGLLVVALGFQVYLGAAGSTVPGEDAATQTVAIAAQTIGAILAAVLWLWVSSIVILAGGVLNAEVQRMRGTTPAEVAEAARAEPAPAEPAPAEPAPAEPSPSGPAPSARTR
jgi:membrane protein